MAKRFQHKFSLKTKVKSHGNFHDKEMPKVGSNYIRIAVM